MAQDNNQKNFCHLTAEEKIYKNWMKKKLFLVLLIMGCSNQNQETMKEQKQKKEKAWSPSFLVLGI